MFRKLLLIVILVLLAIPFFNKAKNYVHEKSGKVKALGETTSKFLRYKKGEDKK